MKKSAILLLFVSVTWSQVRPLNPHPTNVDFSEGDSGKLPPGWHLPPVVTEAGYRAELQREGCGHGFATCVAYVTPLYFGDVKAAELEQRFPAQPYIGKSIRFSAWLRLQSPTGGYIHIRMRVDRANGDVDFFDSAAPPVTSGEWQRREVWGHVAADAVSISIWARYCPSGLAWVATPSFEVVDRAPNAADDLGVRALIEQFARLRNTHDGAGVAALYAENGQWISMRGASLHGREGLTQLWSQVPGMVKRTVEAVDFPGPNVAQVRVLMQDESTTQHHEFFILVKENRNWAIQVHQTLD